MFVYGFPLYYVLVLAVNQHIINRVSFKTTLFCLFILLIEAMSKNLSGAGDLVVKRSLNFTCR